MQGRATLGVWPVSSLHEIYIGYEVGYTSGGIRFAAKGTAKPAEQGTRRPGRVPGIPHTNRHWSHSHGNDDKGPRLRSLCEESVGKNRQPDAVSPERLKC